MVFALVEELQLNFAMNSIFREAKNSVNQSSICDLIAFEQRPMDNLFTKILPYFASLSRYA